MHCEEIACVCENDAIYHDDVYPHYTHIRNPNLKKTQSGRRKLWDNKQ